MNVIARLEYELAYYDSAVHRFNHYTTRTPLKIFLQVVWDLFPAFRTFLSSSTGFLVLSIFWASEAPQERRDLVFDYLKTIADPPFLGSIGLIKCQDVSVGLDSLFAFSDVKKKSKVSDHSRGWPEGSLFDSYYRVGEGATPFPGLLHFTLEPYLIMLSV